MPTLYIKNMVCDRCKAAVKQELDKNQIQYKSVELGEVDLVGQPENGALQRFRDCIESQGFELIEDRTARLVSQIKKAVMEWVRGGESKNRKLKFSAHLADTLHRDYATMSHLFSQVEGTTVEQYLIHQKIERAKELLVYDELSLAQIADQLNYSSAPHLSNQFKKITGLTPGHLKKVGAEKRQSIDKV
jgi:AraC family transcriptional regulator